MVLNLKGVKIMVLLRNLSNFWRTLEMPLIDCDINFILAWFADCVISNGSANQATAFAITDTKPHFPIVSLPTQDNGKL